MVVRVSYKLGCGGGRGMWRIRNSQVSVKDWARNNLRLGCKGSGNWDTGVEGRLDVLQTCSKTW